MWFPAAFRPRSIQQVNNSHNSSYFESSPKSGEDEYERASRLTVSTAMAESIATLTPAAYPPASLAGV